MIKCKVCRSPERNKIDNRLLVDLAPPKVVAKEFGFALAAMTRHKRVCLKPSPRVEGKDAVRQKLLREIRADMPIASQADVKAAAETMLEVGKEFLDHGKLLSHLGHMAFADVRKLFAPDGWTLLPPSELPDELAEIVQEVRVQVKHTRNGSETTYNYKFPSKLEATKLLGSMASLLKPQDLQGDVRTSQVTNHVQIAFLETVDKAKRERDVESLERLCKALGMDLDGVGGDTVVDVEPLQASSDDDA